MVVIIPEKCQFALIMVDVMSTENENMKCENRDTGFGVSCGKLTKPLQLKGKMNVENPVDNVDNSL